jgi:hypothetical protein
MIPEFLGGAPDRDRIISRFRWLNAVDASTAQTRADTECQSPVMWERMRTEGVIRDAGGDLFYLDETRAPVAKSGISRWIVAIGVLLILAAAEIFRLISAK